MDTYDPTTGIMYLRIYKTWNAKWLRAIIKKVPKDGKWYKLAGSKKIENKRHFVRGLTIWFRRKKLYTGMLRINHDKNGVYACWDKVPPRLWVLRNRGTRR